MTPEEYNQQLQALQAKRSIANAMLTSSIAQGQGWGNDRFAHSPLEAIANLGSTYLNKRAVDNADAATKSATASRQSEIADALTQYQNSTPDAQVGQQTLENIRGTPDGQLAAPVSSQSSALKGLARTTMGPDQMAQMAVQSAMTPDKLTEVAPGASLYNQRLGKVTYTAPPKPEEAPAQAREYEYAKQNGFTGSFLDWQQRAQRPEVTADIQGYNLAKTQGYAGTYLDYKKQVGQTSKGGAAAGTGFDDPKIQDLQASMSASGYSLPAGFRSKEQQLALMHGLLRKYDGLSSDDIAHLVGSNAIDYKAVSKATQTAAGIVGKVEVANKELEAFVPIAKDANASVDRSKFVPWNKLEQMGKQNISDPDLKRLYIATNTILNAYDLLAARGGTDKDKRAHNRDMLSTADSPEAYDAALDMIVKEGQAAGGAARAATKASAYDGSGKDAPPKAPGAVPDDIAALLKKHGGG